MLLHGTTVERQWNDSGTTVERQWNDGGTTVGIEPDVEATVARKPEII